MKDFDAVVERLAAEDQKPVVVATHGCRVVLSVRGARVMSVEAEGVPHDPFFLTEEGNGDLTGGDRLWLGPEVAWFWPSLAEARADPVGSADTPRGIDPGAYTTEQLRRDAVRLTATVDLKDARDNNRLRAELERTVRLLPPPTDLPAGVSGLAYATGNGIYCTESPETGAGAVASCWSIAQVPIGGTLVCPTLRTLSVERDVTSYYDDFGPDHVTAGDHAVRFRIDARRRIKMGLKPEDTAGRMGYLRPLGNGRASLILRFFPTLPGERYCDVPRSVDAGVRSGGDCLQAYNDDRTFGEFGEMEHHDPAVCVGESPAQDHTSTTMIFAGPEAALRDHGSRLLGVRL